MEAFVMTKEQETHDGPEHTEYQAYSAAQCHEAMPEGAYYRSHCAPSSASRSFRRCCASCAWSRSLRCSSDASVAARLRDCKTLTCNRLGTIATTCTWRCGAWSLCSAATHCTCVWSRSSRVKSVFSAIS